MYQTLLSKHTITFISFLEVYVLSFLVYTSCLGQSRHDSEIIELVNKWKVSVDTKDLNLYRSLLSNSYPENKRQLLYFFSNEAPEIWIDDKNLEITKHFDYDYVSNLLIYKIDSNTQRSLLFSVKLQLVKSGTSEYKIFREILIPTEFSSDLPNQKMGRSDTEISELSQDDIEKEITKLVEMLQDAFERKDLQRYLSFYSDNFISFYLKVEEGKETSEQSVRFNKNEYIEYLKKGMSYKNDLEDLIIFVDSQGVPRANFRRKFVISKTDFVTLKNYVEIEIKFKKIDKTWKIFEERIVEYVRVPEYPVTALGGSHRLDITNFLRTWKKALQSPKDISLYENLSSKEYKLNSKFNVNLDFIKNDSYQNIVIENYPSIREFYIEKIKFEFETESFWGLLKTNVTSYIDLILEKKGIIWKIRNERFNNINYDQNRRAQLQLAEDAITDLLLKMQNSWSMQNWDEYFAFFKRGALFVGRNTYSIVDYRKNIQKEDYIWTTLDIFDLKIEDLQNETAIVSFTQMVSQKPLNSSARALYLRKLLKLEKTNSKWLIIEDREIGRSTSPPMTSLNFSSQTIEGFLSVWKETVRQKDVEKYIQLCTLEFRNSPSYKQNLEFIKTNDVGLNIEETGQNTYIIRGIPVLIDNKLRFKKISLKRVNSELVLTDEDFDTMEGIFIKE